ncbi:hypothetical protein BC826DRAFT_1175813 [Russula brevipes]|nr:hypothetical protein BC826DRAFT_1175813 [Russula brevipes]
MGSWAVRASHSTATLRDLPQSSQCPPSGHGAMSARIGSLRRRPTVAMTCGRRPGHQVSASAQMVPKMLTIPLLPDAAPSHGALDSGPGPLGDTMTSSRGGSSSIKTTDCDPFQGHDRAQCGASYIRVGLGIVPQTAGAQVRRLRASSLPGPRLRPSVFTERRFAIPSRERRRALRCQCNANGGECRAANTTRTAASAALPTQRERRRAPRSQCKANGGEHRAARATRTAANTAQPVQRERRRALRCQCNANGSERRAANAMRTAASATQPVQRERRRALWHPRCPTRGAARISGICARRENSEPSLAR